MNTSIKQQLDAMLKRSLTLCGTTIDSTGNFVPTEKAVKHFITQLCTLDSNPKEVSAAMVAAWEDGTGNLQKALNAVRVEMVGNFIATESTFRSAFFETQTLADNEEPYVENTTLNEIRVGSVGEDGTPEQIHIVKPESKYNVALELIASDVVKYKTRDIYKGNVADTAQKTIDIARDLRIKLDRIHYNLLQASLANGGCFGAFSYEQTRTRKEQRIYVPHSVINTVHLPTTNDVTIAANATPGPLYHVAGTFDLLVIKEAVRYANAWGNVFPGGTLQATGEIIVPSSDIIGMADQYAPSANVQENRIQEDLNRNGYFEMQYLGRMWMFIGDVTIPKGVCYPRFNLLPGITYEKPSWDKEFTKLDEVANEEQRWQRKLWGAVIINQRRIRALRVTY